MKPANIVCCLMLMMLGGLSSAEVKNGGFENGLENWTVKGVGSVDRNVSAFGKASLCISLPKPTWQRVFQQIEVEPSTEYQLEYYVKCENVKPQENARYAGAASWISMKKYFPHQGSGGPWKLDTASGDWKKVSYKFKTGPEDKTVSIQFQLCNASGKIWIDQVSVTPVTKRSGQQHRINMSLYPVKFMNGSPYYVAENLVGTLFLSVSSSIAGSKDTGEMIFDMPEFIRVAGGVSSWAIDSAPGARRVLGQYQIEEVGTVDRNGRKFRRFRLIFDRNFTRFLAASWYGHFIFLKAEPGSRGKSGIFYCRIRLGKESSPEVSSRVEVLPPILHNAPPCRQFGLMLGRVPLLEASRIPGGVENEKFWTGLSDLRYSWIRACDTPVKGFRPIVTIGGGFWSVIPALQSLLRDLSRELPKNITDKGTRGQGFSVWSKVDDKSGKVEQLYRTAAREIQRLYPEVRDVVWDFEPHPYGYDEGGRKRFARVMKLEKVPSIAEINSKYRVQWFDYMVQLHARYINNLAGIFKEEAPRLKFWLCSDNLHAGKQTVASWCGVDVRLSDAHVDWHMHMPYYAGITFFDDMAVNLKSLKKPFFPLIDPGEAIYGYYRLYNPDKVKQNILAVAALGGKGIGFWPQDTFPADYYRAISESYAMVAEAEDFYFSGTRCDDDFTFTPLNSVIKTVKNDQGKAVRLFFPDFPRSLRTTVHKYGAEYLFTVFNYHETEPLLLEIKGQGKKLIAEVPAQGVKLFRSSQKQDPGVLKKLEDFQKRTGSDMIPELKKGDAALEWAADSKGIPFFRMKNRICSVGVDLLGNGRIRSFLNPAGNELLSGGFLAWLMFYDRLQPEIISKIHTMRVVDNSPELVLKGFVGPYVGANPVPNPLQGMEILRKYLLRDDVLEVEFSFRNPSDHAMTFGFRINNYPFPGKRFGAKTPVNTLSSGGKIITASSDNYIFARSGKEIPFIRKMKSSAWDGGKITMTAQHGTMMDKLILTPDSSFDGLMFWFSLESNTVELLSSDITIQPGKSAVFRYQVKVPVK